MDNNKHNSDYRLQGEIYESVNHTINESTKLAVNKYKTRPDLFGKMIYWKLSKILEFDLANKWYMHNQEAQKILSNLKIQKED